MREFLKNKLWIFAAMFLGGVALWQVLHHDRQVLRPESKNSGGISFDKQNEALVFVGDETISSDDINWEAEQYMQTLPQGADAEDEHQKKQAMDSLREKLLEAAIERKLLINMVRRDKAFDAKKAARFATCEAEFARLASDKKMAPASADGARLKTYLCENSLVEQYFAEAIYPQVKVTSAEIKEYFAKNQAKYHTPEKVVVRQIVLPSEGEARRVQGRVNAGNFRALAKEMSIAPESGHEGLLRPYAKGEMPAVFDVAFSMKVGEISAIQKSNYGFHIFMLEKKIAKREADLESFQDRIRSDLIEARKKEEYKRQLEMAINTVQVKRPRPLW